MQIIEKGEFLYTDFLNFIFIQLLVHVVLPVFYCHGADCKDKKNPLNEHFNIHVSSPRIMQTTETNMT